jgi:hypothetical protein
MTKRFCVTAVCLATIALATPARADDDLRKIVTPATHFDPGFETVRATWACPTLQGMGTMLAIDPLTSPQAANALAQKYDCFAIARGAPIDLYVFNGTIAMSMSKDGTYLLVAKTGDGKIGYILRQRVERTGNAAP